MHASVQESSSQLKFMAQQEAHEASVHSLRTMFMAEVEAARRQETDAKTRNATLEKEILQLREQQVHGALIACEFIGQGQKLSEKLSHSVHSQAVRYRCN